MKLTKITVCLLLALLLALSAAACAQLPDELLPEASATPRPAASPAPEVPAGPYQIGLVQGQDDPTLDAVREAFTARLTEWGFPSSTLTAETLQAGGSAENAKLICEDLAAKKASLIVGLGAPAAGAVAELAGGTGPAVRGMVVSFGGAAKDFGVTYPDSPEGNVTGVLAASTTLAQLDLLQKAVPGLKTLGLLTREGGPLDAVALTTLKENCAARKIDLVEVTLPPAGGDAATLATELAGKVQAVLSPEGGLTAAQAQAIGPALLAAKKPWLVGSEALMQEGAFASVAVSPQALGRAAADMAVELAAGKQLSQVPVQTLQDPEVILNQALLETLHLQLPQETLDAAAFVSFLPAVPTPAPIPTPEENSDGDDDE